VVDYLRKLGIEAHTGLAKTGVVGVIAGLKNGPKGIALRADMDCLPIDEANTFEHRSRNAGRMHACGHDGHTTMLLGAARYLAETRNFAGTAYLVFQPAEEGGGGGKAMVEDGLMERWKIDEVYGMHNMPGIPVGAFGIRHGPMLASTDEFTITIGGRGGHAAKPHEAIDPIVVGAAIVQSLQTIVSRNVDPLDSAVVSTTRFHAGDAYNIIVPSAEVSGTVRTLRAEVRDFAEARIRAIAAHVAAAYDAKADVYYDRNYPVTRNHAAQADFAANVAAEIVGDARVDRDTPPILAGEDFSYMLEARPGAFIFIGNGDSAGLHNPHYDFADAAIPFGASYWVRLVETAMPA
jgi:hippurate hydrolase